MKRSHTQREVGFDEFDGERPRRKAPGEIIHSDESLIVAIKAPGAWAETGIEDEPSLVPLLAETGDFRDESEVVPVYPVGPAISGLVIYPRSEQIRATLLKQVGEDELVLRCLAIVRGHVLESQGVIESDIPQRMKNGPILSMLSARSAPP